MQTHSYAEMTTEAPTSFARWLKKTGLRQKDAAERLGLRPRIITYYVSGERIPTIGTRRLMTLIARGELPDAWPIDE